MLKNILTLFLFLTFISSVSFANNKVAIKALCLPRSDAEYRHTIIGTWIGNEDITFPYIDGVYVSRTQFFKNGDFIGHMIDKAFPDQIIMTVIGKWEIKDGKIYENIKTVSPAELDIFGDNRTSIDTMLCMSANFHKSKAKDGTILEFKKQS